MAAHGRVAVAAVAQLGERGDRCRARRSHCGAPRRSDRRTALPTAHCACFFSEQLSNTAFRRCAAISDSEPTDGIELRIKLLAGGSEPQTPGPQRETGMGGNHTCTTTCVTPTSGLPASARLVGLLLDLVLIHVLPLQHCAPRRLQVLEVVVGVGVAGGLRPVRRGRAGRRAAAREHLGERGRAPHCRRRGGGVPAEAPKGHGRRGLAACGRCPER